ncbi:hypothetical protein SDC9_74036 [bioreactor metagenome]|uniref:Uncharacterized protein n=1 Tax=bioreactor metagenome TaxID=1076179 RepID=A0A644YN55_9ZZZZ
MATYKHRPPCFDVGAICLLACKENQLISFALEIAEFQTRKALKIANYI